MDAPGTLEERLVMQGKPLCDEAFRAITDRNREITRLTAELDEARKESQRLDFVLDHGITCEHSLEGDKWTIDGGQTWHYTRRAAIDDARKDEEVTT